MPGFQLQTRARLKRIHSVGRSASLSLHHLVDIMIPSTALRSLCPLVISPGFLIHSCMNPARWVVGGGLIGLSDLSFPLPALISTFHPFLTPLVRKRRSFKRSRAVHLRSPSARLRDSGGVIDHMDVCLFAFRSLCVPLCCACEDPAVSFAEANLSNERRETGIASASVEDWKRESERGGARSKL